MENTISGYPKIYTVGSEPIKDIFEGPVIVEEKVDGSQFSFCHAADGKNYARSKGMPLDLTRGADSVPSLFKPAVATMLELANKGKLQIDTIYRGEAVSKLKHNVLQYSRIPTGGIIIFDVLPTETGYYSYQEKYEHIYPLGLEVVPLLYEGIVSDIQILMDLLQRESCLGGVLIEGFVIKNYNDKFRLKIAKYVSDKFKEKHNIHFHQSGRGPTEMVSDLIKIYATTARWQKALQHLSEQGCLDNSVKDIGKLIDEIQRDVLQEEEENIKQLLFDQIKQKFLRGVVAGVAQWYKENLINNAL